MRTATIRTIDQFAKSLPFREQPFCKRNWGHPLHSLCSYQGKLKPALAHWLVKEFTEPGTTVLDPLGGVGTVALEACLQGRIGVTNDLSPLAFAVATGKVKGLRALKVTRAIERLARGISSVRLTHEDRASADFGLNGTVSDFFHSKTLAEILRARKYFLRLAAPTDADLFVKACLLHVLHGNRPYALSRTSHPITPFHPSGRAIYKSVVVHVTNRADAILKNALPPTFAPGQSIQGTYLDLTKQFHHSADSIITSPPFIGMRFDRPNWLRLWFCGWSASDFHNSNASYLERQQLVSLDVYKGFFQMAAEVLRPKGLMILHVGGASSHRMVERLSTLAAERFEVLRVVSEDVTLLERHGIRDKGLTTTHELIFARCIP